MMEVPLTPLASPSTSFQEKPKTQARPSPLLDVPRFLLTDVLFLFLNREEIFTLAKTRKNFKTLIHSPQYKISYLRRLHEGFFDFFPTLLKEKNERLLSACFAYRKELYAKQKTYETSRIVFFSERVGAGLMVVEQEAGETVASYYPKSSTLNGGIIKKVLPHFLGSPWEVKYKVLGDKLIRVCPPVELRVSVQTWEFTEKWRKKEWSIRLEHNEYPALSFVLYDIRRYSDSEIDIQWRQLSKVSRYIVDLREGKSRQEEGGDCITCTVPFYDSTRKKQIEIVCGEKTAALPTTNPNLLVYSCNEGVIVGACQSPNQSLIALIWNDLYLSLWDTKTSFCFKIDLCDKNVSESFCNLMFISDSLLVVVSTANIWVFNPFLQILSITNIRGLFPRGMGLCFPEIFEIPDHEVYIRDAQGQQKICFTNISNAVRKVARELESKKSGRKKR